MSPVRKGPPEGPLDDFFAALRQLRIRAGEPSVRDIARSAGQISHDTVHRTLTGPALPRWANVDLVVRALGVDPEAVKPLWLAARASTDDDVPADDSDRYQADTTTQQTVVLPASADLPEPPQIRVLVVDDHPLFRFGVVKFLEEAGFPVVGQARDGAEALGLAAETRPDVVVMDLRMPRMSGIEATALLTKHHPDVRVLVLTMFDDVDAIRQAVQAGATGYLLKGVAIEQLVDAIRQTAHGIPVFTTDATAALLTHYREVTAQPADIPLSPRERSALGLLADGLTYNEIATDLSISVNTVKKMLERIREKTELRNRASLTRYAIEHGLSSSGGSEPSP